MGGGGGAVTWEGNDEQLKIIYVFKLTVNKLKHYKCKYMQSYLLPYKTSFTDMKVQFKYKYNTIYHQ